MPIALPDAKQMQRMTVSELKECHRLVQNELSRRKDIGNEGTVRSLMALAAKHGWDMRKGDVVKYLEQALKGETDAKDQR